MMKLKLPQLFGTVVLSYLTLLAAQACSDRHESSSILSRVDVSQGYYSVGLITYENIHRCTATVLKHGVALTAKHCFTATEIEGRNLSKVALNFPRASDLDANPVFVQGNQIRKIIFDGPSNDIAYVLYEPAATSRLKLDLSPKAAPVPPIKNASTAVVGFPAEESASPKFPRVISKDCAFTGRSDVIKASENDPGYDGLLFETNCDGWWGMSGGPALGFENSGAPEIIGVTTHTFHLTEKGEFDEGVVGSDAYGNFVPDVVISPLSQAEQLTQVLALDLEKIPVPNAAFDLKELCGYSAVAALMEEAKAAVNFLKTTDSFDPLFWTGPEHAQFLPFLRDGIKSQNQAFKDARQATESTLTWASAVFHDYDDLLNSASLSRFKDQDIAHLGVTESFKECDSVACTDYADFVVRLNRDVAASIFTRQTPETARRAMKAVLGHELGHFILDFYLLKGKGFASLDVAKQEMSALKYHLTVDAVGMELGAYSPNEFADVLKVSLTSEIFGEPRFAGDTAERFTCLTKLK